jgi:hypothetical protein
MLQGENLFVEEESKGFIKYWPLQSHSSAHPQHPQVLGDEQGQLEPVQS